MNKDNLKYIGIIFCIAIAQIFLVWILTDQGKQTYQSTRLNAFRNSIWNNICYHCYKMDKI